MPVTDGLFKRRYSVVYLVIGPLPRTFKDRQLGEVSLRSIFALRTAPTASRGGFRIFDPESSKEKDSRGARKAGRR